MIIIVIYWFLDKKIWYLSNSFNVTVVEFHQAVRGNR